MRKICLNLSLAQAGFLVLAGVSFAQTAPTVTPAVLELSGPSEATPQIRAELRAERPVTQSGQPVWVEFSLINLTSDPLELRVPDVPVADTAEAQMGLPLSHVFSGPGFTGVAVKDSRGDLLDGQVAVKPRGPIPTLRLAPHGAVGIRVDLTRYYESLLRRPGKYTLVWRPYGANVESAPLSVNLLAEQQAVMLTDMGKIIIRFYFDAAPNHVQNFIELANSRFYDGLSFHRIVRGGLIQGGDPRGDGTGIRIDGKRLAAEFSKIPFEAGTVGMARSAKDPDSASCQFFICLTRQAGFDGEQTAFGYLVGDESFKTLQQIAAVPMGPKDRPRKPVYIRAVSLESVPPREHESAIAPRVYSTSRPAAAVQSSNGADSAIPPRKETVYRLSTAKHATSEPSVRP